MATTYERVITVTDYGRAYLHHVSCFCSDCDKDDLKLLNRKITYFQRKINNKRNASIDIEYLNSQLEELKARKEKIKG